MNKPEIRIKGFEGEWETTSIEDIANRYDNLRIPVKESYRVKGNIPYYGANGIQDYVDGYTHEGEFILVAEDGANNLEQYPVQYVNGKVWVNNHAHVLQSKESHANNMFLKYAISCTDIKSLLVGGGRSKLNSDTLMKLKLLVPSLTEQQSLASFFRSFDFLIHSTAKKIASLKQIKAASLQSMFPQNGETKPKVRFKGFEGEWEKKQLSDIFTERHIISTITKDLPQLSFTIAEGVIRPEDRKSNKRDFLIKDKDNKKYLVTYVDDIIYNPANVVFGAIHRNGLCNGVVSPIYKIFHTNYDSRFMECVVRHPEFISEMTNYTEGTVTKLKTLKPESFLKMSAIVTSSFDEQQKIGNYFAALNSQIDNLSKKLEKLKQIKSTCLDKMFV